MDQQQPVMQKSRFLWWVAVFIILAFGAGVWAWATHRPAESQNTSNVNVTIQNTNVPLTYTYPGQDGKTALELLKTAYPKTTTKTSGSLGEYVTGIDGHEAGNTEYWQFFVNGKSADVGAGAYTTKASDALEWKLTAF